MTRRHAVVRALGVSHVMRYINLRYLFIYLLTYLQQIATVQSFSFINTNDAEKTRRRRRAELRSPTDHSAAVTAILNFDSRGFHYATSNRWLPGTPYRSRTFL